MINIIISKVNCIHKYHQYYLLNNNNKNSRLIIKISCNYQPQIYQFQIILIWFKIFHIFHQI